MWNLRNGEWPTAGVTALIACVVSLAQTPTTPSFEVSTVKPADPSLGLKLVPVRGGPGTSDPGRVAYTNVSLRQMLYWAYGVGSDRITGPGWLGSDRFDIAATIPPGATPEQFTMMLRNLLAERFHLVVHNESKEVQGYELVTAKGGPKLKKASDEDAIAADQPPSRALLAGSDAHGYPILNWPGMIYPSLQGSNGKAIHLIARAQKLSALANVLGGMMRGPIVDKTGDDGRYDFTLDFAVDPNAPASEAQDLSAPLIPTALQEQLGLRLEPKKTSIQMLIVDSADRVPTAN